MPNEDGTVSQEEAAAQILGDGTTPSKGDATPPATPDFAARALAAEAELDANGETGKEATAEAKPVEDKAVVPPPVTGSKLKALIDSKYGGDENKFTDALYEQWNSTAAIARKLSDLEAKAATAAVEPPPPDAAITQLDQMSTDIDQSVSALRLEQAAYVKEGQDIKAQILELKGEAKRADELDKNQIESKIDRLEGKLERLAGRWEDRNAKVSDLQYRKLDLEQKKIEASARAEQVKANSNKQEQDLAVLRANTRSDFDTSIEAAAASYGLTDKTSPRYQHFYNTIKAETVYFLRSDEDAPPIDIKAYATARAGVYAEMMNLSKTQGFTKVSNEKLQAGAKPAVTPNPLAPAPTASAKPWTAEFARKRAARVLG